MSDPRPIILAFDGDPASAVAIGRLADPMTDVITVTLDLGQGLDLEQARENA